MTPTPSNFTPEQQVELSQKITSQVNDACSDLLKSDALKSTVSAIADVAIVEAKKEAKEDATEACSDLLVSDSFKTAVGQEIETCGLWAAIEDIKQALAHHGINGPAPVEPEQTTLAAKTPQEDVSIQNHSGAPNPGKENAAALNK